MTGTERRHNDMFDWLKERIQKGEKEINVVCFYVLDGISKNQMDELIQLQIT